MPRRPLAYKEQEDADVEQEPLKNMSNGYNGSPSKLFPKPGSEENDDHERPYAWQNGPTIIMSHFASSKRTSLGMAALALLSVFLLGYKSGELSAEPGPKHYKRFVIFAQQRSGSKFLTSLMGNHPHISCGNEELLHMNTTSLDIDGYMKMVIGTFTQLLEGTGIHSPSSTAHVDTVTHVGFKIMYDQGLIQYQRQLLEKLDELDIKVIHLVRRNKLLQYVSYAANKKDRLENAAEHQPHPTTEAEIKALAEIRVSGTPKDVLKYMQKKNGDVTEMSNVLTKYLEPDALSVVNYEELSKDHDKEMGRLFKFLGVPEQHVQTDLAKIHKDKKIHEYFVEKDQDDLKKALKDSEFSWILEDW